MKVLTLIRGASGGGKSYLARALFYAGDSTFSISADDYFCEGSGMYHFDAKRLPDAHAYCIQNVQLAMKTSASVNSIIVHNTFTRQWEIDPYLTLAKEHGYKVQVITCEANFGNVHRVPEETVKKQRERFEHNITF